MKCGVMGISDPLMLEERVYNTSKSSSDILVVSLLIGTDLNYVAHKGCIFRASADGQKQRDFLEKLVMTRRKDLEDRAGLNRIRRAMDNGDWLTSIRHHLNGTELSRK